MLDKVAALLPILDRLTWRRILMAAAAAALAIVLVYGWEHRAEVVPALAASEASQIGLAVAGALLVLWGVALAIVRRLDRQGAALEAYLREEVRRLLARVEAVESERAGMQRTLDDVLHREQRCQRRLDRVEAALRAAGHQPPVDSDWGSG